MTRLRILTPSRLHFGLLSWGVEAARQYGGVGLMIDAPGVELSAEPAAHWGAEGVLAERVLRVAERVASRLAERGAAVPPVHFRVQKAPEEHVGLGVGTQLSLAVARVLTALAGRDEPSISGLAGLAGRGGRSGVGLHGFALGGLIVDGGRRSVEGVPPLLVRLPFPADWSVLVILPERLSGLHGPEEIQAFARLASIPEHVTDRLCRLVLLGLLPAVIERDLGSFGAALTELQQHVGHGFAPVQGGIYARPELAAIVADLKSEGLHGVGQSSWGPTLYAFSEGPPDQRSAILDRLRNRFGLGAEAAFWTRASESGATVEAR